MEGIELSFGGLEGKPVGIGRVLGGFTGFTGIDDDGDDDDDAAAIEWD